MKGRESGLPRRARLVCMATAHVLLAHGQAHGRGRMGMDMGVGGKVDRIRGARVTGGVTAAPATAIAKP